MAAIDDNNIATLESGIREPAREKNEVDDDVPIPIDPNRRPECFTSTIQECLFVLTATMSLAMGTLLNGACSVITAPMAITLNMNSAEITWVQASAA